METIGAVQGSRQNVYHSPMLNQKQETGETPQYVDEVRDWEEATRLLYFHSKGQFQGTDGKLYEMDAEYAEDATQANPTVQVTVTDENGNVSSYHINIRNIDTGNATEIEMFALCSHADTRRGQYKDIPRDTLSSWESLLHYREMKEQNVSLVQDGPEAVPGMKKYNWRDMMGDVAENYINDGVYHRYLNVNRMKDMLEFYSHFQERPDAFENTFHAIRDYEFIRVLSLDGVNIEIYDKQKKIVCSDLSLEQGSDVLWSRTLTDEELLKALEIVCSPHTAYMKDFSFWDGILSGRLQIEDYDTYVQELRRQKKDMFANCPPKVKEAWKRAEKETGFHGLGLKENGEIEFISEYMRVQMERMQEGMDTNLLGMSMKSAVEMAEQMIERLEESDIEQLSTEERTLKLKERIFYRRFLEQLDPKQKYDPAMLLLTNRRK